MSSSGYNLIRAGQTLLLSTPGSPGDNDVVALSLCSLGSVLLASDIGRESSQLTHRVRSDHRIYISRHPGVVVSPVTGE